MGAASAQVARRQLGFHRLAVRATDHAVAASIRGFLLARVIGPLMLRSESVPTPALPQFPGDSFR